MIYSMTAYAREEYSSERGNLTWELRSINHRYLELNVRLPEAFRSLEPRIREQINQNISRGKLECSLNYSSSIEAHQCKINMPLLQELAGLVTQVQDHIPYSLPVNAMDVLSWPGLIQPATLDLQTLHEQVMTILSKGLATLIQTRAREGASLRDFLLERLLAIDTELEKLAQRLPLINKDIREKLSARLVDIKIEYDNPRLEQEIVLQLQKADVAEEMNRLKTHVAEIRRIVNQGGVCGRRLDFLMQELHREANTLGAKSIDYEMSNSAVELKVLIDQMREQIQNIE